MYITKGKVLYQIGSTTCRWRFKIIVFKYRRSLQQLQRQTHTHSHTTMQLIKLKRSNIEFNVIYDFRRCEQKHTIFIFVPIRSMIEFYSSLFYTF